MSSKFLLISSLIAVALAPSSASLTGISRAGVLALPGYQVTVWAHGTKTYSGRE
jgi:predicted RecA/RadA family phage recombinase